uniref:Hexosyltransferase n=1 Tax=Macrostomum lignano TaxID=282301 RepID=A0A1I8GBG9_9PLAT
MLLGVAAYCTVMAVILSKTLASDPKFGQLDNAWPHQSGYLEKGGKVQKDYKPNSEPSQQSVNSQGLSESLPTQKPTTLQYRERCWRANFSSPERRPVDHTPRPFLLGESAARCRGDIFLLIAVQSAVQHRARRDLIRATWAAVTNIGGDRLQTVFFVGTTNDKRQAEALRRESDSRADIVQADFVDTYRNLTYKHLYALRWIAESCRSVRYVMKVDDDVVLNVFRLRESLRELVGSRTDDFFYCQVSQVKPIRNKKIKWHVTYEEYPDDRYPDYCKGFGYVMSFGLIEKLHQCAKWRRYFWIDDVFVSGDLASALGAPRIQWEDGWGAKRLHPRLAGPEANQMVLANAGSNAVAPSLNRRVWRAIVIRSKPIRNRRHKWYVAYEEWPGDRYPDYCKGFGYVMSFGLIEKLHQCAKWRRYFWIDDVFVSGDLASALGAPRIQWEDGWGAKRLHPRLAGPEANQMVLANADGNFMVPSLNRRVWRAIVRFSDWGWEDGDAVYSE